MGENPLEGVRGRPFSSTDANGWPVASFCSQGAKQVSIGIRILCQIQLWWAI